MPDSWDDALAQHLRQREDAETAQARQWREAVDAAHAMNGHVTRFLDEAWQRHRVTMDRVRGGETLRAPLPGALSSHVSFSAGGQLAHWSFPVDSYEVNVSSNGMWSFSQDFGNEQSQYEVVFGFRHNGEFRGGGGQGLVDRALLTLVACLHGDWPTDQY